MPIFSKSVYKETELAFITDVYSNWEQDREAGVINIEAYGEVDGEYKYFYSSFILKKTGMYDNGDYEQMIELLKDSFDRKVKVMLKYKKSKLKYFKMSIESLAKIYSDERFLQLELVGWGISDKSHAVLPE